MEQMRTNFSYNTSQGIPQRHINYRYQLSEEPLPTGLCMFHSLHFFISNSQQLPKSPVDYPVSNQTCTESVTNMKYGLCCFALPKNYY